MKDIKKRIVKLLRWSQKYTKTDMVYIAKGSFWLVGGKVFIVAISLATTVAFANLIPKEVFGTYQFIISVAGIVGISALPGMGNSLIRSIAKGKEGSLSLAFKTKFRWALLGSLALFFVSAWYYINENNLLALSFLTVALIFPIKVATSASMGFWNGKKRFDLYMVLRVLADIGIAGATIAALFLSDDLVVIVGVFFGSSALFHGLAHLYSYSKIENNETDDEMVPLGKNLTLMGVIGTLADYLDKIILWKLLGPVQVAIYTLSLKPISKVSGFLPIATLALPKLSENGVKGYKRKRSILRKVIIMFMVSVPFAVALAVAAPIVYKLLFPQYMDSVKYFQTLTFLVAMSPTAIIGTSLLAEMKTKYLYITSTVAPIMKIALFLILAPIYGVWGIISALLITSVVGAGMNLYFFWKM